MARLTSTEFNGVEINGATTTQLTVQIGIQNLDKNRVTIDLANLVDVHMQVSASTLTSIPMALSALGDIDGALASVNQMRSDLGASQNRLEVAISSGQLHGENLTAASSRIWDADYAHQTAEMVRLQIQASAGVAAMAQANKMNEGAVKLLL